MFMWVHVSRCLHARNADVNPTGRFCVLCQLARRQSVWIPYMSLTSAAQCARAVSFLSLAPFPLFFFYTLYLNLAWSISFPVYISAFFSHLPLSLPVSYKQSENHFSEATVVTCLQYVQLPPLTVPQKDSMIEVYLCTMSGNCMCFHLIHPLTTWTFTFRWHNRFWLFIKIKYFCELSGCHIM